MIACPLYTCKREFPDEVSKVAHLREYHGRVIGTAITPYRGPNPDVLKDAERSR